MNIGEAARRAGVTVKTLRYYESLGLVRAVRRANGYRNYSEEEVRRAAEIRSLGRLGIRADRTRPFLDCLASGRPNADDCPASLAGYREAIAELTDRIEALTARRTALVRRLRDAASRNGLFPPTEVSDQPHAADRSPVPQDDGAADHLRGLLVPQIELPSTTGDSVALNALGPGRSIIYLYPLTGRPDTDLPEGWDAIPGARGCTAQARDFRDHSAELAAAGAARVFGLSSQDIVHQREVAETLRLPFPMLSDAQLRVAKQLALPTFTVDGRILYRRMTLVIVDGAIEHVFYPVLAPDQHARQVLAWLWDNTRSAA